MKPIKRARKQIVRRAAGGYNGWTFFNYGKLILIPKMFVQSASGRRNAISWCKFFRYSK